MAAVLIVIAVFSVVSAAAMTVALGLAAARASRKERPEVEVRRA